MTTATKDLSGQESNFMPLEKPVQNLSKAINDFKSRAKVNNDFEEIERAFKVIQDMVFSKKWN